jgi:hypothetical protein
MQRNHISNGFVLQQFLWALLVMALTGNMIHNSWSGTNSAPSIINYTMFCAVWAMLTLFYLIPASVKSSFSVHAALPFALDLLNTIFWFCAAVAFAAKLGVRSCSDDVSILSFNHSLFVGSTRLLTILPLFRPTPSPTRSPAPPPTA